MLLFEKTELLYENPLSGPKDTETFVMEGQGAVSFPMGRMRLDHLADPGEGQKANIVFWCPEVFPDHIAIEWEFWPIREPGLCILFFAAAGKEGENVLDPRLSRRTGEYDQYHHGDIHALHVSYFRRRYEQERAFHTCNLRKSYGFHMVAQGADPIPSVPDAQPPYSVQLVKSGPDVLFSINGLEIFHWTDDGTSYGPILEGGQIGFRQMAPLIAEYANLRVHRIRRTPRGKLE
jgi:hypothetical protein